MKFKIGLTQFPVKYHKTKDDWANHMEKWFIENKKRNSQILVFPEYGSMDLVSLLPKKVQKSLNGQLHEVQNLHSFFLNTLIQLSKKYSVYTVAPSFPLKIGRKYFNRAYFIGPAGQYEFQDKIHMTRFENEKWNISPSETELKIFETGFGKIGIQICLDIEFAWASGLLAQNGVHTILAPSCTETMAGLNRVHTGAKARALENQIYVGVSQTVGRSDWSFALDINTGMAAVYSTSDIFFPQDGVLNLGTLNKPSICTEKIDVKKLGNVRQKGQVFNFEYNRKYSWKDNKKASFRLKRVLI